MTFSVTEPHPTVRASSYIHAGRGGAGNMIKAPKVTTGRNATGPASLFEHGLPVNTSSKFSSGRGGAGNIHLGSEKAPFSFDEELERQSTRAKKEQQGAPWHVGRGGAGNWANCTPNSRKDSISSQSSTGSGIFRRLSQTFERR
ncbi:hypothetical protein BP6252_12228 [Coleophoma cylindrospora]|uniref:Uncharacterized protein n=1 Tax=Coleophoma cylindrospora TaxID=1849047 RepID=A0A3D8QGB1_9HELO|nr:hypothetical protein BP6252_12228 [Coleophoma cylindrospora]